MNLLNGVSGIMRVKNEEKFISLSIDSCIDALDELIIVYQDCDDNTPKIIHEKTKQYPRKIKAFHYKYSIKSHHLSEEEFELFSKLPSTSPNLLSSYYNYALSKCSYKYCLKIDADQIYNSNKLLTLCNAYRSNEKVSYTSMERFAAFSLNLFASINSFFNRIFKNYKTFRYFGSTLIKNYENYVIKNITNKKNPVNLCGFNLYIKESTPYLGNGTYNSNGYPPFNGVYDHIIFEISPYTYYLPNAIKSNHTKYGNCIIERFNYDKYLRNKFGFGWKWKLLQGGFMWFHIAPLKSPNNNPKIIPFKSDIKTIKENSDFNSNLFNCTRFWAVQFYSNYKTSKIERINIKRILGIL